jgi:hypothetical protein
LSRTYQLVQEAHAMKHLTIRVYNSNKPPFRVRVWPGISDGDALFHLKLYSHVLVPNTEADHLATEIAKKLNTRNDDLYERAQDGDTFIAIHTYDAGRILWEAMMRTVPPKETAK